MAVKERGKPREVSRSSRRNNRTFGSLPHRNTQLTLVFRVTSRLPAHPIFRLQVHTCRTIELDNHLKEKVMKKFFGSFALACILAASMSALAQDSMKQDSMSQDSSKQDSMKKDDSKNDSMKKDDSKKTKKAKTTKKDTMKKDDNMKHDDNMKNDQMKQN